MRAARPQHLGIEGSAFGQSLYLGSSSGINSTEISTAVVTISKLLASTVGITSSAGTGDSGATPDMRRRWGPWMTRRVGTLGFSEISMSVIYIALDNDLSNAL